MKVIYNKYRITSRFVLAIQLFTLAILFNTVIDTPFFRQYSPYISAILLFIATCLLYKIDRNSLQAIGLNLSLRNLTILTLGLLIVTITLLAAKYASALYTGETFAVSETINYSTMLYALYFILPTISGKKFLFRGYLFKKTIEKSNVSNANIIFSVLFIYSF